MMLFTVYHPSLLGDGMKGTTSFSSYYTKRKNLYKHSGERYISSHAGCKSLPVAPCTLYRNLTNHKMLYNEVRDDDQLLAAINKDKEVSFDFQQRRHSQWDEN
jgi:hypothetical protein